MKFPWQMKILVKIILARLPVPYSVWAKLGLFKHGKMASTEYANKIFNVHMKIAEQFDVPVNGVYLEMGTGDSVATALMSASRGSSKTYLVDVGDYATRDMEFYTSLARQISDGKALGDDITFEEMLKLSNSEYLTAGLQSLKSLPDNFIDFIWSHATMEHVLRREFLETVAETFRVLRPGGIVSHNIDYKDHLGGALNNLRFSEGLWEHKWMAPSSGFYTNRLRHFEVTEICTSIGFLVESNEVGKWDVLPTPKEKMAEPFCNMPEKELLIRSCSLVLRKPD